MKSLLFLFSFFLASLSFAAERWQSPDKVYSIVPPEGWRSSEFKVPGGFPSYGFRSPDGKCEIRISAAYGINLPATLPDRLLDSAFPNERGVAAMEMTSGAGWDGLRREYVNAGQTAHWLGIAARRGTTAVLLTMQAPEKDFARYRPVFEAVGASLQMDK